MTRFACHAALAFVVGFAGCGSASMPRPSLGPSAPAPGPAMRDGRLDIELVRVAPGSSTVSFGIPLRPGLAATTRTIGLYDGDKPIQAAIKPLLFHHDADGRASSLRAILVQFPMSQFRGSVMVVTVAFDESLASPSDVVAPFASVSTESPETALVTDRTITKTGGSYALTEANTRRVTLFTSREPVVQARFPDGYLADTGILGPLMSASQVAATPGLAGLKFLSDQIGPFVTSATYEDTYPLNPAADSVVDPVYNYEGWLYDRCTTLLTAYAHTGDPVTLRHGMRQCSYYSAKITLTGTNRGIFSGKDTADSKYSHARGLYAYYALTGDEGALASLHAIADLWHDDPYFVRSYRAGSVRGADKLWTERLLGTALEGLYYGYRATGDGKYLDAFREMLATAYRHITLTDPAELALLTKDPNVPPFPAQNCFIHNASQAAEGNKSEPWCSGWMTELVIESLLAYQNQTNDPRVDEIFIRLARFLRDVGSAYFDKNLRNDFFLAPSICYDPGAGVNTRRLVPLYGAGLRADGTRLNNGEYSDFEHCPDATALTAAALRGLVRQGRFDQGGPIGPFPSEGASFLALHHELAACGQRAIEIRDRTVYRDPASWTSSKLAAGASDPAGFIAKYGIGYPSHATSPQRKLSWWFNTSMLQFALLRDAGITIPTLRPGAVQPAGCSAKAP